MSPSMPCTSVMCVTRRVPSRSRVMWTIRLTAEATCSRMARSGMSIPAISTSVSRRAIASRGELAWTVEMEPSWPVFMACSMSRRFAAADLAHHNPVRPHAQRVPDQVADGDLALALDVRRAAFQPDHVLLLELELHGVLDGYDPLVRRDEPGQDVEEGGLSRAGAAGDDDVHPGHDAGVQELRHLGG